MTICLLGDNGSVHVQKWVEALSLYPGIALHVISFNVNVKFNNVHYHELKPFFNNKFDYFWNIPRLKRLIKSIQPDILHSHYATSYGFMGAVIDFHPYIITGWGSDIFDSPRNYLMRLILKYSFTKADAITVLTQITLKEISKLTDKKVELVPFGVDLNKFTKQTPGNNSDTFRIGTIRTLSAKYGVEYLVRAFARLYLIYPKLKLEIVGDGLQMKFLQALALELGIADRIVFHGYISQTTDFKKYIGLLQSFDVFVIPSILDSETFGVAAVEASACSIPVIGTEIGGLPEVIDENVTGLLVPVKNSERLAEAIEKIYLNKRLRQFLGQNGRKKTERLYNWSHNVKKMADIYYKVIEKG